MLGMLAEGYLVVGSPDARHHQDATWSPLQHFVNVAAGRQDVPHVAAFWQIAERRDIGSVQVGINQHHTQALIDQGHGDVNGQRADADATLAA